MGDRKRKKSDAVRITVWNHLLQTRLKLRFGRTGKLMLLYVLMFLAKIFIFRNLGNTAILLDGRLTKMNGLSFLISSY